MKVLKKDRSSLNQRLFSLYETLRVDNPNQGHKGLHTKVMTFSIFCRQQREKLQKNKRNLLSFLLKVPKKDRWSLN